MRVIESLSIALFLSATAVGASAEIPDPDAWYRSSYAPLWNAEKPAEEIDAILAHYAQKIVTHSNDGEISRDGQRAWLAEPMAEWVAEGWLRAELTDLETRSINDSTASFVAKWTDHYADGSTEVSCGWYLADYLDGGWIITEYADTPCS